MINIVNYIRNTIIAIISKNNLTTTNNIIKKIQIQSPENKFHFATNASMLISKINKKNPIEIAEIITQSMKEVMYNSVFLFTKITIAEPGFINFSIENSVFHQFLHKILTLKEDFSKSEILQNQKINLEFVSANPTGPMHIGHVRGAVIGDVLTNLLKKMGANVTKEYYINDSGKQILTLIQSVFLRYNEINGEKISEFPSNCYPGEYIIEIAKKIYKQNPNYESIEKFSENRQFIINQIMQLIKKDLNLLKIHHDIFRSEQEIVDSGKLKIALKILEEKNLLYHGSLPKPENKVNPDWEAREQLLFKSTEFGDEFDRGIFQYDGSNTYFGSDIAYFYDKSERKFEKIIMILGSDHIGYETRFKAMSEGISENIDVSMMFYNIVNFLKNGEKIKMSKRSGNFLTAQDVADEVGIDALRFMMIWKTNESLINFDLDEVLQQSKDNPIFYIQYAHVRCYSVIQKIEKSRLDNIIKNPEKFLTLLNHDLEIKLIQEMLMWPEIVECAAKTQKPHQIPTYLYKLATIFHNIWSIGSDLKFISENENLTNARILMVSALQIIIQDAFKIIHIDPINEI